MPFSDYISQFSKGAAGGAGVGMNFGWEGAAIGALVGGAASLFEDTPEQQMAKRKDELRRAIIQAGQDRLQRGTKAITGATANISQQRRRGAISSAIARGYGNDAEAFAASAEQPVVSSGMGALREFQSQTNDEIDQALLSVDRDYAARPIQPGISDALFTIGKAAAAFKQNKDYLDTMTGGTPMSTAPTSTKFQTPDTSFENFMSPSVSKTSSARAPFRLKDQNFDSTTNLLFGRKKTGFFSNN